MSESDAVATRLLQRSRLSGGVVITGQTTPGPLLPGRLIGPAPGLPGVRLHD